MPNSCYQGEEMSNTSPEELLKELEGDTSRFRFDRWARFQEIASQYEQAGDHGNAERIKTEATAFMFCNPMTRQLEDSFPRLFTPEQLKYLAIRARGSKNPIHASCFADVVWDFSEKKDPEMARIAIDRYLEAAEIFKHNKWGVEFGEVIKRAASLASMIQDPERLEKVKKTIIEYTRKLDATKDYRFCLDLVEAITKLGLREEERLELIKILEKAAAYYEEEHPSREDSLGPVEGPNEHFVQSFLKAELELFPDKGSKEAQMVRRSIAQSHERKGDRALKVGNYIAALVSYQSAEMSFVDKADKDRMRVKLAEAGSQVEGKLLPISVEVKIETAKIEEYEIEEYVRPLLADTLEDCLARLAAAPQFIPNVERTKRSLEKRHRKFPLQFLIPKIRLKEGHIAALYTDTDEVYDQALARELIMEIQVASIFRSYLFDRLRERGLDTNSLIEHFQRWGYCQPRNLEMLRRGFDHYFAGDYPASLHILIPQFEDILRALLQAAGRPVSRPPRGVATLGALLSDSGFISAAGADLKRYYELVLTDGLNLRNDIAHGLLNPESMTKSTVELIIHLLLTLTRFKAS